MKNVDQAISACISVLDGAENNSLPTPSILMQCLKIARLSNDTDSIIWLQYECGGYPRNAEGRIIHDAWEIAYIHGRGYMDNSQKLVFSELSSELNTKIEAQKSAIRNFSTQGVSVSGDHALVAMNRLTSAVSTSTESLLESISTNEKKLSILWATYYDYALRKYIELSFGNVATDVFSSYRVDVDDFFFKLSSQTILRLRRLIAFLRGFCEPNLFKRAAVPRHIAGAVFHRGVIGAAHDGAALDNPRSIDEADCLSMSITPLSDVLRLISYG